MYDNYIDDDKFFNLLNRIRDSYYTDTDYDKLKADIEEAYADSEISSGQYDKLIREFDKLEEY